MQYKNILITIGIKLLKIFATIELPYVNVDNKKGS